MAANVIKQHCFFNTGPRLDICTSTGLGGSLFDAFYETMPGGATNLSEQKTQNG